MSLCDGRLDKNHFNLFLSAPFEQSLQARYWLSSNLIFLKVPGQLSHLPSYRPSRLLQFDDPVMVGCSQQCLLRRHIPSTNEDLILQPGADAVAILDKGEQSAGDKSLQVLK